MPNLASGHGLREYRPHVNQLMRFRSMSADGLTAAFVIRLRAVKIDANLFEYGISRIIIEICARSLRLELEEFVPQIVFCPTQADDDLTPRWGRGPSVLRREMSLVSFVRSSAESNSFDVSRNAAVAGKTHAKA
jgi:hypothetical protein